MINRDELLKMARDSGLDTSYSDYEKWVGWSGDVINFANAILERAAVECEEDPFANHPHIIRALKTKGE